MEPTVPAVEVTDDAHGLGPRRPHGEGRADDLTERAVVALDAGAEHLPQLLVATLVDQVQVHLPERRREAIGVVTLVLDPVAPRREDAVVHRAIGVGTHPGEHALGLMLEVEHLAVLEPHPHRLRQGLEHADPQPAVLDVLSQQIVRLLVPPLDKSRDRAGDLGAGRGGHVFSFAVLVVVLVVLSVRVAVAVSRAIASSGIVTQSGRFRASYTTSYIALSSSKAVSRASW